MGFIDNLVDNLFGPWCQALDPEKEPVCWTRVPKSQPGGICDECWVTLAGRGAVVQRIELAKEPDIPPPAGDLLVADPSQMVKAGYAASPALFEEHRDALCQDEAPLVQQALAGRDDLSVQNERTIIEMDDKPACLKLAASVHRSAEATNLLSKHRDPDVREAMNRRR